MTITLPPHLVQFIQAQVECGRYGSPDEVVHAALQQMSRLDDLPEARLAVLRADIEQALAEEAVEVDLDTIKAEGRARHEGM